VPSTLRLLPACVMLLSGCMSSLRNMDDVPVYNTSLAQDFLLLNIQARADRSPADEWRSCDRTLQLGYGDCEDFASCAWQLVASWRGCISEILVVQGSSMLHAVTTVTCENGLNGYFDNGVWVNGNAHLDYPVVQTANQWLRTTRAAQLAARNFSSL